MRHNRKAFTGSGVVAWGFPAVRFSFCYHHFETHFGMTTERIYRSHLPDVPVVRRSIFTHLLGEGPDGLVGGFPGTLPAFIDAPTSFTLSRAELRALALRLAYGLTSAESLIRIPLYANKADWRTLKKGDTVLIYSPNSIAWPPLLFGAVAAGLRITVRTFSYPNLL